jgi:ribonuclease HI
MYVLQMHFPASNNAIEYEALLHGLRITTALGICRLKVLRDSLLIVNHANKEWSCLNNKMLLWCQELHKLENNFKSLEYLNIVRGKNKIVDELAKLGSSQAMVPTGSFCRSSMCQVLQKLYPRLTMWPSHLRRLYHPVRE